MRNILVRLTIIFAILLVSSQAEIPSILWQHDLEGSGSIRDAGIRKGNGVILSKRGDLWVTNDEGALYIIDGESQTSTVFMPPLLEGRHIDSRSSVVLYEPNHNVIYGIYAIIDIPHPTSNRTVQSRVLAVNKNGSLRWSLDLEGVVSGTPVISADGNHIYVTHNVNGTGSLSVLTSSKPEGVIFKKDESTEYGPLALTDEGLFWGDATDLGMARNGTAHFMNTSDGLYNTNTYSVEFTSTVPPVSSGESLWFGGRSSTLYGMLTNRKGKKFWRHKHLDENKQNSTYPISNRITSSDDGTRLYVTSASSSFYCLNSTNGRPIWKHETDSVFLTSIIYSPLNEVVYSIQHLDGKVTCHDAFTGQVRWDYSCKNTTADPTCEQAVEAEFSISVDETTLYFGNIFGKVTALLVASPFTDYPSNSPSILLSSSMPSTPPTISPSSRPTSYPTTNPTRSPTSTPSLSPTERPTKRAKRSKMPTSTPTYRPSAFPSLPPTLRPTPRPTKRRKRPRKRPSPISSSVSPRKLPTDERSEAPSLSPSDTLVLEPIMTQSERPSSIPTCLPGSDVAGCRDKAVFGAIKGVSGSFRPGNWRELKYICFVMSLLLLFDA